MNIQEILSSKEIKPKAKVELIVTLLHQNNISLNQLIQIAANQKEVNKANCIEAMELVTRQNPGLMTKEVFEFVVHALPDKAPRIKWESARVIANTVMTVKSDLKQAVENLLLNTRHEGTVVRWSAAQALTAMVIHQCGDYKVLLPQINEIMMREEKASIQKIYRQALKKAKFIP